MRMETMKEESDREWEEFEKNNHSKAIGGKKVVLKNPQSIPIHDFVPTMMCNLFHADDIATILWILREPFECNYLGNDGRDRFCQFKVRGKHFDVYASGYGMGETIEFEIGFDTELQFRIMRLMSWDQSAKEMARHEPDAEEPEVAGVTITSPDMFDASKEMHEQWYQLYKDYRERIYNEARTLDDLFNATADFHNQYHAIWKEGHKDDHTDNDDA